jgi:hypothetical protein
MTLTSVLPTLRRSIPSPFARDVWPAGAVPTLDDVVLEGVSVLRYVDLCGTPCVITGSAVIPLSGGMASSSEMTTILTASVVEVDRSGAEHTLVLDAVLDIAEPSWHEARLIGRVSAAHDRRFDVRDAAGVAVADATIIVPADLAPGDTISVPCRGGLSVGDVRRHAPFEKAVA